MIFMLGCVAVAVAGGRFLGIFLVFPCGFVVVRCVCRKLNIKI